MEPNKTLTLFDVFSISDREGELRVIFHEGIVQEAVVDKEKKIIKTSIKLPCICAPLLIEKAQEMIKVKYGLSRVIIAPKYPEELLGDEYFKSLIDRVVSAHPAASAQLRRRSESQTNGCSPRFATRRHPARRASKYSSPSWN